MARSYIAPKLARPYDGIVSMEDHVKVRAHVCVPVLVMAEE
jgi:hypothetical protein